MSLVLFLLGVFFLFGAWKTLERRSFGPPGMHYVTYQPQAITLFPLVAGLALIGATISQVAKDRRPG